MTDGGASGEKAAGKRVLFVDDDDQLTSTFGELLGKVGFEVTTAGNGRQALGLLGKGCFDAMVLDLAMPGTGGIGVLKELRRRDSALPVIIHSGYLGMFDEDDLRDVGAYRVMTKPVGLKELVDTLREAIDGGSGGGGQDEA